MLSEVIVYFVHLSFNKILSGTQNDNSSLAIISFVLCACKITIIVILSKFLAKEFSLWSLVSSKMNWKFFHI